MSNQDINADACFLCSEKTVDMELEISSLKEPMSEVEMAFILEQCPVIDRNDWATLFHAVPTDTADTVDIKSLKKMADIVVSEPPLKLEICHICG